MNRLKVSGINVLPESWTPPAGNHLYGFVLAEIPSSELVNALRFDFIKRIDLAESELTPQSNNAIKQIQADYLWASGITGQGVKIGILDSGLDTEPLNPDLPLSLIKKDYSSFPTLDDDVENKATGHGTLVTGIVAGQGFLSADNTGNGGGAYKGAAPGAEVVFLKVGNDINGGAGTSAILNAMDAAVTVYGVNLITLSYGSWDIYHDGSGTLDQKVDWCYSQGVPVFLAAGNFGSLGRHFSGLISAQDSTDFIQVNVTNAVTNGTTLAFNLVYFDGLGIRKDFKLKYYSSTFEEITNVYHYIGTESTFGSESRISQTLFKVPAGNGTYYLRVINNSNTSQSFNLYEHYNDGLNKVKFANPDSRYTIVSPATATYGFAVGAYTSAQSWVAYNGSTYSFGQIAEHVSSYSSQGPRIDGLQKPDLVAPGSAIISIRDRDIYKTQNIYWINNNSDPAQGADYLVSEGTSFAAPFAAGAAALLISKYPGITPQEVYTALRNNTSVDGSTGSIPNAAYGYGKLNAYNAVMNYSGSGGDPGGDDDPADDPPAANYVVVNAKVFLEGPLKNYKMNKDLLEGNKLPLEHPYGNSPWNYEGNESVSVLPNGIVDWMLVELRTNISANTVAAKRAVLIREDGILTDLDGISLPEFNDIEDGDYYIVIRHRNHLSVMTASPVYLSQDTPLYDFTDSDNKAYGSKGLKKSGKYYAMYAGDGNGSGSITIADRNEIWSEENGQVGYKNGDFNLSSGVTISDLNQLWNKNNGTVSQVPEN